MAARQCTPDTDPEDTYPPCNRIGVVTGLGHRLGQHCGEGGQEPVQAEQAHAAGCLRWVFKGKEEFTRWKKRKKNIKK